MARPADPRKRTGFFAGAQKERVLVNYIREMADHMGMRDWSFFLTDKPAKSDTIAQTRVWRDQRIAEISMTEEFFMFGPKLQRETLCHELVHWIVEPVWVTMKEAAHNLIGGVGEKVFMLQFDHQFEAMVDQIAAAWAIQFPLIDWRDASEIYKGYEKGVFDSLDHDQGEAFDE